MPHDIDKGLQAGFFCYLIKPIDIDALTAALDSALAGAEPPRLQARAFAAQPAVETRSTRTTDKTKKDHAP
jgi:DNA-binding NarL/FixJ family response regulator